MEGLATLSCFFAFFDFFLERSLDGVPSVLVDICRVKRRKRFGVTEQMRYDTSLVLLHATLQTT